MRIHRVVAVLLFTLAFTGTLYARHHSASPTAPVTEVEGVIKSVTTTQLVVTDNHNNDVTINITPDTIFRHGDLAIPPADLMPGDHVEVKAVQKNNALDALVVKVDNEEGQGPKVLEISGVIKSVSPTEIVVTDAKGNDTTVEITNTTIIRKGDMSATVADLVVGDKVEVKAVQTATALDALEVKAEKNEPQDLLEVSGVIKSVSATEIVVTNKQQMDTTFEITPDTKIMKDGKTATAADLAMGDQVEVLGSVSGTTNTALVIHAETPEKPEQEDVEVSGTVKATGSNQITVTTGSGKDVVVQIDSSTRIRKGDKSITAADIKTGDRASAEGTKVDAQTILASVIEVSSGGGHD